MMADISSRSSWGKIEMSAMGQEERRAVARAHVVGSLLLLLVPGLDPFGAQLALVRHVGEMALDVGLELGPEGGGQVGDVDDAGAWTMRERGKERKR